MRAIHTAILLSFVGFSTGAMAQSGMTHTPGMPHTPDMQHAAGRTQATQSGQAVFAAITEIAQILQADSTTDWMKVDLEALRQHLIDMDNVTMRARVRQSMIEGGLVMDITGDATVAAAIRRMVGSHSAVLQTMSMWRAKTTPIPGGTRLTVTASNPADSTTAAQIRGLGFIGVMVQGDHHTRHHLLIARGAGPHAHKM
jgi:hypothetical protein